MDDARAESATARAVPAEGVDTWFAGAQRGDPAAVDGLLRVVFPTAQRFAARSCANREDAEEAAQDALTALVRRVGALRAAETVTSWLFVTIRRSCLRRISGAVLVPIDVSGDLVSGDIVAGAVDRIVVADALAALPPSHREVIVLVDLVGLPAERTAERLGIGVRAAKSRLHRARRALAASLEAADVGRSA